MYSNPGGFRRDFFYLCTMKKIALISDTHGLVQKDVLEHMKDCDEIWHAGDFGGIKVIDQLEKIKPMIGVYGNIDDHQLRRICPLDQIFECEGVKVFMTHIGGYPGRYSRRVKDMLDEHKPDLYICGHSHICKIMKDEKRDLIHINPGACGIKGFHILRTMVLFECENSKIQNLRVVELGPRARIK